MFDPKIVKHCPRSKIAKPNYSQIESIKHVYFRHQGPYRRQ